MAGNQGSSPQLDSLLSFVRRGSPSPGGMPYPAAAQLEPAICSTNGSYIHCRGKLTDQEVRNLHNEGAADASTYPLRVTEGLYFSEVVTGAPSDFSRYQELIAQSMKVLADRCGQGAMSFEDLLVCGLELQALDERFAQRRIGAPPDILHSRAGPDSSHPYAKITVCRSAFPVTVGASEIWFFFEKFLVSYSYLDERGERRPTTTPVHSHPLNFETVYFTSFGPLSRVTEQEFLLVDPQGLPLVDEDGKLRTPFTEAMRSGRSFQIETREGSREEFGPEINPRKLPPFDSERVLQSYSEMIAYTDGLFRPHKVTVLADPDHGTSYFALDNYFGPRGRVFLYKAGRIDLWQHGEWRSKIQEP